VSAQVSAALPGSAKASKYISEGERSGMASNFSQGHIGECWCAAWGYSTQHLSCQLYSSCVQHICSATERNRKGWQKQEAWEIPTILPWLCWVAQVLYSSAYFSTKKPPNLKPKPCYLPASNGRLRHNVFQQARSFEPLDSSYQTIFPLGCSQMLQGETYIAGNGTRIPDLLKSLDDAS